METIQGVGKLDVKSISTVNAVFLKHNIPIEFKDIDKLTDAPIISFTKKASTLLKDNNKTFFNWDLLFSVLGPNDNAGDIQEKLEVRIEVLKSVTCVSLYDTKREIHGSLRVNNLAKSSAFYTWLFGTPPSEWTHRYVTFKSLELNLNFVLLVADGKDLHQDTLYHLGVGVDSKEKVIDMFKSANKNNFNVEKPPRTTWRGTPLHEMWLKDPDGTLIEIYSRLTAKELIEAPDDLEPLSLV